MPENSEIIAIGSDHAGYCLKEFLKERMLKWGLGIKDFGTSSAESVDYPDLIHPLASAINNGEFQRGVIICGSGNGVAMVANKYPQVRAALCWNADVTVLARQHNDANVIALPARFISEAAAEEFLHLFLNTPFEGGRHQRRVSKIPLG